ncbi:NAD-dependent epimerase/dehydratase family protein [Aequorivita marina]|uniref:NAD-dependent epimerase/dehydratase family protein n=1 Tax=Aequorivita marina TaxID=3073654 RepID=UPI0028744B23|nr:NAD-dependent epimerase/dehydratase family protein [Aequorivita sp. S2608]MDS1299514.1 NAD-dependent epimerase/dehydratase family protein [Aequorivita sp. S2608]
MILVTGGTGMVGSDLLYFLVKEDAKVRATHRRDSDIESVRKIFALYSDDADVLFNKIEWVEADINDIPALNKAFKDVTKVYHCAAIINFNPSKYNLLKKVNVEGTANIVNLCLANKVEKLCYVSSVSTLGKALGNQLITEETPWNPDEKNSVYGITKYGAEMEVWRGTQEGLNAVIVNPGVILGSSPSEDGSAIIVPLGSSGIPFYPSGSMGIVDVRDVVKAMLLLMDSDIKNERFILVSENISYKKMLSILAPLFGKKPPTKKLSKGFMLFLSKIDWLLNKLFGVRRRLVKATVRSMFTTSLYDSSKVKEHLNFEFTPTRQSLERVAKESGKASG